MFQGSPERGAGKPQGLTEGFSPLEEMSRSDRGGFVGFADTLIPHYSIFPQIPDKKATKLLFTKYYKLIAKIKI